ncbi:GNAT family N-acetyltransferase [Winogradskya consettensis]|uniref:Acetyltransferase n=1 Tax=Winogradskya consettensis TaxID=113560 RepID=A0A919W0G8_9ACTN|nr:GNAT family N-acetyltransferase [Actinoplanes consettensis]GIM75583.1 acetyltransferase [Actinoplanes consettensis]
MTVTLRVDATPTAGALTLRPWNAGDVEALVEIYRDPTLRRWTSLHVEDTEGAKWWLDIQDRGWRTGKRLSFAVLEDDLPGVAGYLALKRPDPQGSAAGLTYWTAAHARGRGVAPRALEGLSTWALSTGGLRHLELIHEAANEASCRVAGKASFRLHHTLPDGSHVHMRDCR